MTATERNHIRACKLLGVDPERIRLVGPAEWKALGAGPLGTPYGRANSHQHGKQPMVVYVRRTAGYDTSIHEVLHHLFPSRPHWWIFEAAWKLAGIPAGTRSKAYGYGRGYVAGGHKLESRKKLIALAQAAAIRIGAQQKEKGNGNT